MPFALCKLKSTPAIAPEHDGQLADADDCPEYHQHAVLLLLLSAQMSCPHACSGLPFHVYGMDIEQ